MKRIAAEFAASRDGRVILVYRREGEDNKALSISCCPEETDYLLGVVWALAIRQWPAYIDGQSVVFGYRKGTYATCAVWIDHSGQISAYEANCHSMHPADITARNLLEQIKRMSPVPLYENELRFFASLRSGSDPRITLRAYKEKMIALQGKSISAPPI